MGRNISDRIELLKGWRSAVYASVNKIAFTRAELLTRQTLTVAPASAVTAGDTSITLATGLTTKIEEGHYLRFEDADGLPVTVKVTADAAVAATALTIEAAPKDIIAGATAYWPPEIYCRTDAQISRSVATQETVNFNTGGDRILTATTASYSVSLPGTLLTNDPGYLTLFDRAKAKRSFWLGILSYPTEIASDSIGPSHFIGLGFTTDFGTNSPADNFMNNDITVEISGTPDESLYMAIA